MCDIGSEQLLDVLLADGAAQTLTPLTKLNRGQLHDGNAYIISASHLSSGDKRHVVYTWVGKSAPAADREQVQREAARIAQTLAPPAKVVPIAFGKETDSFLVLFRGQ